MKKFCIFAVFLLLLIPLTASAIPVDPLDYSGTRSTANNGITSQGGWDGEENSGFEISWSIFGPDDTNDKYSYFYTISGVGGLLLSKDLSHWILEVTSGAESGDFTDVFPVFSDDSPETFSPGPSNLDMPADIYGIKWEIEGQTLGFGFSTLKDPVWGDFYAKSANGGNGVGNNDGIPTVAFNIGFGEGPDEVAEDFTYWIARPNGTPVPEPTTLLLLGTCLIGLVGLGRKKIFKNS